MGELISLQPWQEALAGSWAEIAVSIGEFLPTLAQAILILLVGWLVAKIVSTLVRRALSRFGFDRTADQLRLAEILRRVNISTSPSTLVGGMLWWVIMVTFVLSAIETLGLSAVTATIDRFIAYLPNLAAAALILVGGLMLARLAQNLAQSGAGMAGMPQASHVGSLAWGVVVVVTSVLALEQLGVETDLLARVITVLVATVGLSMGATFALGARPVVTHILAGHALRKSLPVGRRVEVAGRVGTVEDVGKVETTFRDGDQMWTIPNAVLLEEVIVY